MQKYKGYFMMVILLALPLLGWGQQPIVFDTVQLNPINSFLIGHSVFETDSDYMVFGIGGDGTGTVQDQRSFRFDGTGGLLETKVFTNTRLTDAGRLSPVTRCASGGFASGVSAFGNGIAMDSLYMYRYAEDGDTLWTELLMADTTLAVRSCAEMGNGDLVLVGLHEFPKGGFMYRTTSEGDSIRFVNFGYPAFYGYGVVEDDAGDLYIAGYAEDTAPYNGAAYLHKCTPEGQVIWRLARPRPTSFEQVIMTHEGNLLAMGGMRDAFDRNAALIALYTTDGEEIWSHEDIITADNATRHCSFTDGFELPDSTFIVCGSVRNYTLGLNDKGMLFHLDANGEVIWSRFYAHYPDPSLLYPQFFYDVEPTRDGGFILTGNTHGPTPPNSSRLWLLKLDSLGCLVPGCHTVGVEEFESELQSALQLSPNPASERVQVSLALPEGYRLAGAVQAMLVDAQGKVVLQQTVPANGDLLRANLEVVGLLSGLYYVHLRDAEKWLAGGKVVVE
jgi:outer membrane protein assembly factor BamB